jgi:hypothetical protein
MYTSMKGFLLSLAAAVSLLAVLDFFTARESIAQAVRAAWVRDADNAARHAVTFDLGSTVTYTVPAGKILVLEDVNVFSAVPTDPTAYFTMTSNGQFIFHDIAFGPVPGNTNGVRTWVGGRATRLYGDPGSVVQGSASGIWHIVCSGYLLDVNP